MTAFRSNHLYEQCLDWCSERNNIPKTLVGGAYIMVFAIVNWSDSRIADISFLENLLRCNSLL